MNVLSILLVLGRLEDQVALSLSLCRHGVELSLGNAVHLPLTLSLADVLLGIHLDPLGFSEDPSCSESLEEAVLVAIHQRGGQHVTPKELSILLPWNWK